MIEGGKYFTMENLWNVWKVFVTVMCVLMGILLYHHSELLRASPSSFANPNDTGYNNRYVAGPDGKSLYDKMVAPQARGVAAWQAKQNESNVSGLTGSRDVPVFFEDYDYDMQVKGGNVYNKREGFGDPVKDCGIPGAC